MSFGSGRGRGRGIPINYPDGWACKPHPTPIYPRFDPAMLPKALRLSPSDREVLSLGRKLRTLPGARSFVVAGPRSAPVGEFRYSDRGLDLPTVSFSQVRGSPTLLLATAADLIRLSIGDTLE